MNNCLPWDITAADADDGKAAAAAGTPIVRRLIVVMLLTAAALDLARCGLVMAAARHPAPTAGLVAAGLAAAALTARTARGCQAGQPLGHAGQHCSSASRRPRKRPRPASAAPI